MSQAAVGTETIALSHMLRPRSIGDILDATIRLYRRHFLLYFGIVMIIQAVVFVFAQMFQVPMHVLQGQVIAMGQSGAISGPEDFLPMIPLLLIMGLGFVALLAGSIVGYQFSTGGLVVAVSETFLGRSITIGDSYRAVATRFWSLLGAVLLTTLIEFAIVLLGIIICVGGVAVAALFDNTLLTVISGVGAAVLILVTVLVAFYFMICFLLVPQVVMLEGASATEAVRRSWQLMRDRSERGMFRSNVFRASIILLVVVLVSGIVIGIVLVPLWILAMVYMVATDAGPMPPGGFPLWIQIPMQLVQTVAGATITPVGIIAMLLLYYDIRIRFEGFDLQVLSSELASG